MPRGIYPAVLRDQGLVEAVRSVARRSAVAVTIRACDVRPYAQDVGARRLLLLSGGTPDIAKHAGAETQAAIRFWPDGDKVLQFEIADNGTGFDPGSIRAGNGLANMRDRIEAVGGTLAISSSPRAGTVIRGRLPADAVEPAP